MNGNSRSSKITSMPPSTSGSSEGNLTIHEVENGNNGSVYQNHHQDSIERESLLYSSTSLTSSSIRSSYHHYYNSKDKETHDKSQLQRNALKVGLIFLLIFIGYHLSDPEKVYILFISLYFIP